MSKRLTVALALTLSVLWLAAGWSLSESALRVPRRTVPRSSAPEVTIEAADGVPLKASFVRGSSNADCVMLLHGIGDSRAGALGFAPMFLESGYSVLAPDSRAHGTSGGEFVTFGFLERADVLRWAVWLTAQGCRRVFGLGESLGGSILIQAAADRPAFAAIVAECPYRDLPSVAEYRMVRALQAPEILRRPLVQSLLASAFLYARLRYGLDLRDTSAEQSARRLTTPLLLIHGDEDHATPKDHSQAIAAGARNAKLWIVPGALHTGASAREPVEFRRRVLEWFSTHGARYRAPATGL